MCKVQTKTKFVITSRHAIRVTTVPKAAINMAASILREIAPFDFEVEVEVESPPDKDPVELEGCGVVAFAAGDANWAPTASAAALKAAKDSLLPSDPGLTANTIPWPQWLAAVFEAWRQCIQMGSVPVTLNCHAGRLVLLLPFALLTKPVSNPPACGVHGAPKLD